MAFKRLQKGGGKRNRSRGKNSWGRSNKKSSSFKQAGRHSVSGKKTIYNFYPHGKPDIYSYTEHFVDVGNDIDNKAFANTQYPGLDSPEGRADILNKALINLKSIIDGAREAELKFLADTGIDIDGTNGKDIFKYINLIFNSQDTIDRGLKYMKQLSTSQDKKPSETYREVTNYFASYLNEAIATELKGIRRSQILHMTPAQVEQYINNIISRALLLSYEKVQDFVNPDGTLRGKFGKNASHNEDEQAVQAISDMISVIQKLRKSGAFKNFGDLFNLNKETLYKWRAGEITFKKRKGNKYNNAKVESNYNANALEVITSTAAAMLGQTNIRNSNGNFELSIVGEHTGQWNNMKADTLLFVGRGDINIPDYLEYKKLINPNINGVRSQNVDALSKYWNLLENNVSHVIAISDKNYSITADFNERGIHAQSKQNLSNAADMLSRFGVGQVKELINYLANCGAGMVQGGAVHADIRTELQTYIAYYLFDHLEINISGTKSSVNVVNLINVSGMYLPLSVYLEGLYNSLINAINEFKTSPAQFVSVSISLGGPTSQRVWTEENWRRFREMRESNSFIEYTILKNLSNFITSLNS